MQYACPRTLPDALELMAQKGFRVLAGGTDLYPATGAASLAGNLVDLSAVTDLRGIVTAGGALRIGAMTTWSDVAEADLPPALHALQQAARQVGGRQIQNRGTLGGNLCNASPAADGVPPLLAADANVVLEGVGGQRVLPLSAFILGPRRTSLHAGEVLSRIEFPASGLRGRSCFVKLGARSSLVISIAMVAARIEVADGLIRNAALAVGSCGPVATRLPALEAGLQGAPVADAAHRITAEAVAANLRPIDDIRATAAYRLEAAAELLRRAVAGCLR